MLIWNFSNKYLDIYEYVGKFLEQHFSVGLFSDPGVKIVYLLKFNDARISEWNLRKKKIQKLSMEFSQFGLLNFVTISVFVFS